jgi:hypothetical protein
MFVFEDVHWADRSQLDLLDYLASRIRGAPAVLLILARPELLGVRPSWGHGPPRAHDHPPRAAVQHRRSDGRLPRAGGTGPRTDRPAHRELG